MKWPCPRCGFDNAPHMNRMGDQAQLKCEQCGADHPERVKLERAAKQAQLDLLKQELGVK